MSSVDFDAVLASIQDRVRERRANGDYPLGLEAELEAEFDVVLKSIQRDEVGTSQLEQSVANVGAHLAALNAEPELESRLPGGSAMHSAASRVVRRHTEPLTQSIRSLGESIHEAFDEVVRVFDAQRSADERQVHEVVADVYDRLALLDAVAAAVSELEARVDRLERAQPAP